MRKFAARLIKKTENPLHRAKGKDVITFPEGCDTENIQYMLMLGNASIGTDGSTLGVGDYDADTASYKIKLRVHGKNLISGNDLAAAHSSASVCTTYNITSDSYIFKPKTSVDGTVILGKPHIRFKEGTRYTLCAKGSYTTVSSEARCIGLAFTYSDGTSSPIKVSSEETAFTCCVSSEEGKSLVSITAQVDSMAQITLTMSAFGIFEGVYGSYGEAFIPYDGDEVSILLCEPLRRIGYTKDMLDMKAGTVRRWIQSATLNAGTPPIETEYAGIFRFALPSPIADGSAIQGLYRKVTLENMINGASGFALCEDPRYIYFRSSRGAADASSMQAILASSPVSFTYVRREPDNENTAVDLSLRDAETTVEVITDVIPRELYGEYI